MTRVQVIITVKPVLEIEIVLLLSHWLNFLEVQPSLYRWQIKNKYLQLCYASGMFWLRYTDNLVQTVKKIIWLNYVQSGNYLSFCFPATLNLPLWAHKHKALCTVIYVWFIFSTRQYRKGVHIKTWIKMFHFL